MTFRTFSLVYFLVTTIILSSLFFSLPDQNLHLIACDVGQGDSFLITHGFHQILIDGGRGRAVLSCLDKHLPFWDRQLDMVVASHDDDDHIGGLKEVVERYEVKSLVYNGKTNSSNQWQILESQLGQKSKLIMARGQRYTLKGMDLQFIWPVSEVKAEDEDNQNSVVLRLEHGSFSVIFTGDIDTVTEENLIKSSQTLASTVLKVSHHGSKSSTSDEWLTAVTPIVALIGVGKNSYGHPHPEVLERLQDKDVMIYRTDKIGAIELVSDGKSWWRLEGDKGIFGLRF